jgi:hypothetical protein
VYLAFFVSCHQSSELLTADLYFVLNTIFVISFLFYEFEQRLIQGDYLQKRVVSEGVFKKYSRNQPFFPQVSLNQLQRSNTFSNSFDTYFLQQIIQEISK